MAWYVYIIRCADNSLYSGVTVDVARRLQTHNSGKGAKYTRGRGPVTLAYLEPAPDRGSALRREHAIKKLPAAAKRLLVATYTPSNAQTS